MFKFPNVGKRYSPISRHKYSNNIVGKDNSTFQWCIKIKNLIKIGEVMIF